VADWLDTLDKLTGRDLSPYISGLATDAAGDLFIADIGHGRVVELPWIGKQYGQQTFQLRSGDFDFAIAINQDSVACHVIFDERAYWPAERVGWHNT
jgi:hypothetical protein